MPHFVSKQREKQHDCSMCRINSHVATYTFICFPPQTRPALTLGVAQSTATLCQVCPHLQCTGSNLWENDKHLRSFFETRKTGKPQKFHQSHAELFNEHSSLRLSVLLDYVRSWGAISGPENSVLYPAVTPTPLGRSEELRRWYRCCFVFFKERLFVVGTLSVCCVCHWYGN